jgi:hypothetical protein
MTDAAALALREREAPTPTDADVERVAAAIMAAKAFGEMWIDPVAIARAAIAAMPAASEGE